MKRRLSFLAVLAVAAVGTWLLSERTAPKPVPSAPPRAFLNAAWGMTSEEVAQANGVALAPSASGRRYHDPEPGSEGRYRTLESREHRFLGRPSVVSYTFLDEKLVSYHVFVSDQEGDALDRDMRRYLEERFGAEASDIDDDPRLKRIWQSRDLTVNYWFYEDELALSEKFKAAIGVLYKTPVN